MDGVLQELGQLSKDRQATGLSHTEIQGKLRVATTFASRWQTEAKCITTLYAGQAIVSQEIALFDGLETTHIHQPDALTPQAVTYSLPDSALSSCKWLETST